MAVLLTLVLVVTIVPTTAFAASNEQQIFDYVTGTMGLNTAAACGVLANIERESSFNPHAECIDTNGLTSYGICQWNGARYDALRNYCSARGYDYTTLNGQLHYLQYELEGSESSAYYRIKNVENTADRAYTAGYNWARYFERCAQYWGGVDQYATRGNLARNTYGATRISPLQSPA
ncbi:MAG: phage tail tip lysozyme [Oscillospiraceae bacterium]|nr:phage tail tip lysozyme [Oscillospiraceae bacterium]